MSHQLDHERLDVYQIEEQFIGGSTDLIVELFDALQTVDRFSAPAEVREDPAHYGIEDDDEDEKEGGAWRVPADRGDSHTLTQEA